MSTAGLTMPARRPPLDPARVVLISTGGDPNTGYTIMQAVALTAGEPPSEQPAAASPVLAAWLAAWADSLPDGARQNLRHYIWPASISRGTPEQEAIRCWLARDWLVRVRSALWLHAAGLVPEANELAGLSLPYDVQGLIPVGPRRRDWFTRPRPDGWVEQTLAALSAPGHGQEILGDDLLADTALAKAIAASSRTCESTWRTVFSAAKGPGGVEQNEQWGAIADATWPTAHIAARYLLHPAARAALIDPGRALLRRPRGTPRTIYEAACDIAINAADAVAWSAVATEATADAPIWRASPEAAWRAANILAHKATAAVQDALDRSAHQLVDQLLALTRRGERQ